MLLFEMLLCSIMFGSVVAEWRIVMSWLLIVVLAILAVNALYGFKRGLIRTIFSFCSLLIAIVLTIWINPMVGDMMKNNDKFYNGVIQKVEKMLPDQSREENIKEKDNDNKSTYINKLPFPKSLKRTLMKKESDYRDLAFDSFRDYISHYVADIIINALAFILTFAIMTAILWAACFMLNIISKLPILNQINKLAGMMAGLLQGLVIVWLFFILLTVLGSSKFGQDTLRMIGEDDILSLIYNNNILLGFITGAKTFLS